VPSSGSRSPRPATLIRDALTPAATNCSRTAWARASDSLSLACRLPTRSVWPITTASPAGIAPSAATAEASTGFDSSVSWLELASKRTTKMRGRLGRASISAPSRSRTVAASVLTGASAVPRSSALA
jgi:hypothetical protein